MKKRESRGELKLPQDEKENSQPVVKAPLPPKPHEAGKVPKYLQKYKEEAQAKKEANDVAKEEAAKLRH